MHRDARERVDDARAVPGLGHEAADRRRRRPRPVPLPRLHDERALPVLGAGRDGINYLRASALAVVDAFDGRVTLYAADRSDPILRAWRGVYPGLFADAGDAARVRARAPALPAPAVHRAGAGLRDLPRRRRDRVLERRRRLARATELAGPVEEAGEIQFPDPDTGRRRAPGLPARAPPGDARGQLHADAAFTPRGRENLVGYLAGSVDASLTPRLTLLSLPRDRLTTGPDPGDAPDPRRPRRRPHAPAPQPRVARPRPRLDQPHRARRRRGSCRSATRSSTSSRSTSPPAEAATRGCSW